MKPSRLTSTSSHILCIGLALAVSGPLWAQAHETDQPRYLIQDLGPLPGGNFSQAGFVNNNGFVAGVAGAADGTQHAAIWRGSGIVDAVKRGLGGPNSFALSINEFGVADGQAESSEKDPYNENFCAYGTGLKCLPFVWRFGSLRQLPTLGGNNASVGNINNRGEVTGYAEKGTRDPGCLPGVAPNGTGPQVLGYEGVLWGPRHGEIRKLRPLRGDTVSAALWVNDNGEAVGVSGDCANTIIPPIAVGPHAVLWGRDGSVHNLGTLGGTVNPAVIASGQVALGINNQGEVIGTSALKGNTVNHAFLWTRERGMRDLGTVGKDLNSAAQGINERGQIVGSSYDTLMQSRAFLAVHGKPTDLNTLVCGEPSLYLLVAFGINTGGEIAGFGVVPSTGEVHGYLATPCNRCNEGLKENAKAVLSENARKTLTEHLRHYYHMRSSQ